MAKIARKWAVIFVLVLFLGFTALSAVMYLAWPKQQNNLEEIIAQCEAEGWVRDEERQGCFEDPANMVSPEEECNEKWGTRYAENEVCVE